MGTQLPLTKKTAEPPQFSTPVYCGQTAAWIKMPLGMMVGLGLGQGNIVLDADPAPPWRGTAPPPNFGSWDCWIDQDATWYEGRPRPGRIVLHGDPAPPPKRGTASQFLAHVYCGQTVAHLSYCWALVDHFYEAVYLYKHDIWNVWYVWLVVGWAPTRKLKDVIWGLNSLFSVRIDCVMHVLNS